MKKVENKSYESNKNEFISPTGMSPNSVTRPRYLLRKNPNGSPSVFRKLSYQRAMKEEYLQKIDSLQEQLGKLEANRVEMIPILQEINTHFAQMKKESEQAIKDRDTGKEALGKLVEMLNSKNKIIFTQAKKNTRIAEENSTLLDTLESRKQDIKRLKAENARLQKHSKVAICIAILALGLLGIYSYSK